MAEVLRILLKHPYLRRKENASAAYLASNIALKEHAALNLPFPSALSFFGSKDYEKQYFEFYYDKIAAQGTGAASSQAQHGNMPDDTAADGDGVPTTPPDNQPGDDTAADGAPSTPPDNQPGDGTGNPGASEPTFLPAADVSEYADASRTGRENTELWAENEWVVNLVNEKIEIARQSRSWGTIPGRLQELIIAAMRVRLDFRRVLGAFRQSVLSSRRNLTRMKPSRRYDFQYMGSRRSFSTRLLFALDVSGSVPSEDLRRGLATLNQFFRYGIESVDVVQFDTEIKGAATTIHKARRQLEITGRGGTNFNPVIDYLNEHPVYDGAIIFTDGFAPAPAHPAPARTRLLWLFNTEECYAATYEALQHLGKGVFLT